MFTSTVRAWSVSAWLTLAGVLTSAPAAAQFAFNEDDAGPNFGEDGVQLDFASSSLALFNNLLMVGSIGNDSRCVFGCEGNVALYHVDQLSPLEKIACKENGGALADSAVACSSMNPCGQGDRVATASERPSVGTAGASSLATNLANYYVESCDRTNV